MHELMLIFEVIQIVCMQVLIRHLEERKETRWSLQENKDYPKDDKNF